jgi:hypothetical protein
MEPIIHCPADPRASAEAYLTNRMLPDQIREFEAHQAQCVRCAVIVESVKAGLPVSFVHQTGDGPVHLWAVPDQEGGWRARIWGRQLAGARRFATMAEANQYLRESFAQMFHGHQCGGGCRYLEDTAHEHAADKMHFEDYSE